MEKIKDICFKIYIFFKNIFSSLLPKKTYEKELSNEKEEILIDFEKNENLIEKNHKYNLEDFIKIKTLGKGSFGKVLLVKNKYTNEHYAMKILNKDFLKKEKQINHTKTEREILEKINHPFIIKLKYAFQTKNNLYMLTDFMIGGEIYYLLQKKGNFTEKQTKFYICELVLAIGCLHKNQIIYRDLKPENILLDKDGHIKLVDFGLSKILNNERSISISGSSINEINYYIKAYTLCGTKDYLAPEILKGKGYEKVVDWFSLGSVMYEMLTGFPPFKEKNKNLNIQIYNREIYHHKKISDLTFDLIKKLLIIKPEKRLGYNFDLKEIQSHPYFNDVNWDFVYQKKIEPPFKPYFNNFEDVGNFDPMFTDENIDIDGSIVSNNNQKDESNISLLDMKEFNISHDFSFQKNDSFK